MRPQKTAYQLRDSQVATPKPVVDLFWRLIRERRGCLGSVLDAGAGDGRFASGGNYQRYVGVEIDPKRAANAAINTPGLIEEGCAFRHAASGYDACIGNPPYVRHHDIESPWKEKTSARLEKDLGVKLDRHGNLYLYFLCLGLIKTNEKGLVSMVIPFEWVSRPSAAGLRKLIAREGWNVSVYRFQDQIFPDVLTTASISIIDKAGRNGEWKFFDIDADYNITGRKGISGSDEDVLAHQERGDVWARRGLSPGSQEIFTLTEGQRIHSGLTMRDVVPCVTTLRYLPRSLRELTTAAFQKQLVDGGKRCWLIKSNGRRISENVKRYLAHIPPDLRQTYTCLNQDPWYAYETVPVPRLLFHSGFTHFGPKVIVNAVGAHAVGSVYGIHAPRRVSIRKVRDYLTKIDFEARVVAHAKTLKKIEVKQVNTVLSAWSNLKRQND